MLPVIDSIVRVSVFGTIESGAGWSNTFHYLAPDGFTFDDTMENAAGVIEQWYSPAGFGGGNYGVLHYSTDGTTATQIVQTPLDGISSSRVDSIALAGSSNQAPLPGQNAIVTTLLTGARGRSNRGRQYWPSNNREVIDGTGHLAAADVALIEDAWPTFDLALQAMPTPCYLYVASYTHATARAVTGFVVRNTYGHQTKRRGRGA